MIKAIVFDGDDTLWHTEWLYDRARQEARGAVEAAGLDGEAWERRERLLDVENVARLGHDSKRFPTSCVEAYDEVCELAGQVPDPAVRDQVWAAAQTAFTGRAPLVKGAEKTLAALHGRGILLALLTKGDSAIQRRRIGQSGLARFFDLIEIVDEKTPATIARVVERLGVSASDALMVGNSVRSDILPSLVAGVAPVWIDAHVWEYERDHEEISVARVTKKEELSGVLEIV